MQEYDSNVRARRRWDAENMKSVTAKVRAETADEFAKLCKENGETMHSILKKAIEDYISEHK